MFHRHKSSPTSVTTKDIDVRFQMLYSAPRSNIKYFIYQMYKKSFVDNLFEMALSNSIEEINSINFMISNFENDDLLQQFGECLNSYLTIRKDIEIDYARIDALISDPVLEEVQKEALVVRKFLDFKLKLITEMNSYMSQDSFETIGKEFGTFPIQTINAKLLQIFFRIQIENLDEKILRRLTRECLALEYAKERFSRFMIKIHDTLI